VRHIDDAFEQIRQFPELERFGNKMPPVRKIIRTRNLLILIDTPEDLAYTTRPHGLNRRLLQETGVFPKGNRGCNIPVLQDNRPIACFCDCIFEAVMRVEGVTVRSYMQLNMPSE